MELRIKEIREDNDLTQKQIYSYLRCDQSLYSKYERNIREISLDFIVKLSEYYNTSVDYLLGLTDEKNPYPRRVRKDRN